MSNQSFKQLRSLYQVAVEAVKPDNLIKSSVKLISNTLQIQDNDVIALNNNCYVVGFGKAVLGMAVQLEKILGNHIQRGVLSIPHGFQKHSLTSKFEVYEGAIDNIPDADAVKATQKIKNLMISLSKDDVLIVLISGGGSALLVSPIDGLTLEEKKLTTRLLSQSGATINELNSVRKALSGVKGGKLAQLAYPTPTISLILSDVIGNPLDVIASGPTVSNKDVGHEALKIIRKYDLTEKIPRKVVETCERGYTLENEGDFGHVHNFLIGNNLTALLSAERKAIQEGYSTLVLGDSIQGDAKFIGRNFAVLAKLLGEMMSSDVPQHSFMNEISVVLESINVHPRLCCRLERLARSCSRNRKNLCLIAGGESTVKVLGSGLGGRNQEMVLSFLANTECCKLGSTEVAFMSAGTDGSDGPTDAAGALTCSSVRIEALNQGLDPNIFLGNNDSYNFFKLLSNGAYHIRDGPTGTNVMDFHVLCIFWTS